MSAIDLEVFLKKSGNLVFVAAFVGALALVGKGIMILQAKDAEARIRRANAVCPALLSIGRSSRDTLIVMRADDMCNEYVLKNFK